MSHIVEAKTSLRHPDLGMLRQAVEIVAAQHEGGRVESYYLNFSRKRQSLTSGLSLFTNELIRGIGFEVNSAGEVVFRGDPWGVDALFAHVQQEIVQTYVSLATMQALQALGYDTQALQGAVAGQVVIQGVQYA